MTFDVQPTLRSELLDVRPLQKTDFTALYTVASDPLLGEQHPASDRYEIDVFKAFFQDAIESHGALIVVDRKSKRVIGSSRYHAYNEGKRTIEIGWTFLARECWGGAYNGDLKRLMLQHAFRFVDSVLFLIGPENWRSRKAVEKIGACETGARTEGPGGTSLVYALSATDYH